MDESLPPPKRPRTDCIIHCTDDDTHLVSPIDFGSWTTLLKAAEIRDHGPILSAAKDLSEREIAPVQYHRRCRSVFTNKKDLNRLTREKPDRMDIEKDEQPSRHGTPRQAAGSFRVYEAKCIFCDKVAKYLKGQRSKETLVQCKQLRADVAVRQAAVRKMDDRILSIVSREIVAAEAHYHRSCYRQYTKASASSDSGNAGTSTVPEGTLYESAENTAYKELFDFIRNEIFPNPKVLHLIDLTSRLLSLMNSYGINDIRDSTKTHMRRKLESEFGESLHFVRNHSRKVLVYPDTLTRDELACGIIELRTKVETLQATRSNSIAELSRAALLLRSNIKRQELMAEWPPQPSELGAESANIPDAMRHFLQMLIVGQGGESNMTSCAARQICSIGQDLIYAVTNGRRRPPKHVLMALVVKCLTGNVELIQILNRLGHCISYSMMEQIETALCMQKLHSLSDSNNTVILPADILISMVTTLVWDNIDKLEETLSGGGTSHRVNGIAIQDKFIGPLPKESSASVVKSKKRSIDIEESLLPQYNAGERVGPAPVKSLEVNPLSSVDDANRKNRLWVLIRQRNRQVPNWTGFNILTRGETTINPNKISYLPTINAPATEMTTVLEILTQSQRIRVQLQLPSLVLVFDQALYAKAAEIVWKHPDRFDGLVLRMGDFHTMMNFLSIIGKRFQDAGLRELAVESGLIAEGSVQAVMDGRQYNRAVRLHKLVYEAMLQLTWKEFLPWLKTTYGTDCHLLDDAFHCIEELSEDINEGSFNTVLHKPSVKRILHLFETFLQALRDGRNGDLARFWMSYLDMVDVLLGLIRASREGDWLLNLHCIKEAIPWAFAYDKINYARYLPVYYAQMSQLPTSHPEIHAHMLNGGFSVQRGSQNPFGKIPADQTIEETVNRDTKTPGGTKGFSLRFKALSRYYMTAEYRSTALRQMRDMVRQPSPTFSHSDLHAPRIQKDHADTKALVDLLENDWVNPMNGNQHEITSISTGRLATPDIKSDLTRAHEAGAEAYKTFKENRLEATPPVEAFHSKISKQNLKTFSNLTKKKRVTKADGKDIILQADRQLFAHMILAAESRQLDLKEVMGHPLGPIPWSLATPDGSLRKTNKAALAKALTNDGMVAENIPRPSATIIDGMSLVQRLKGDNKTFTELADSCLALALHEGANSQQIDVVFDVYREQSIKNAERSHRGTTEGLEFKNISRGHKIRQWRKFLCSSSNKTCFIQFVVDEWKRPENRRKLGMKVLYVTCEERCFKLVKDQWEELTEMKSTQEEADTRVLLHAGRAAENGCKSIVITAEDTDILVLCIGFSNIISSPVYQKVGTKNRQKYIDITEIANSLGKDVCKALIGLHAFTGCDTVSAFAGKGKLNALKLTKKTADYQQCFSELGRSWQMSNELFAMLEAFTCHLYVPNRAIVDVNQCRYQLFTAKRGNMISAQLPPCRDCLFQHAKRANYQAAIWRRSLECAPEVIPPTDCGWSTDDSGDLEILWMTGPPAPSAVLELMSCSCVRHCDAKDCTCIGNGLKCTKMCRNQTCDNQNEEDEADTDVDADDESDDDGSD